MTSQVPGIIVRVTRDITWHDVSSSLWETDRGLTLYGGVKVGSFSIIVTGGCVTRNILARVLSLSHTHTYTCSLTFVPLVLHSLHVRGSQKLGSGLLTRSVNSQLRCGKAPHYDTFPPGWSPVKCLLVTRDVCQDNGHWNIAFNFMPAWSWWGKKNTKVNYESGF